VVISLLVWLACADERCPLGSMTASVGGLVVTEEEHPTGWNQGSCFSCHALAELHRTGCTEGIDLGAVRTLVEEDGEASCQACHGTNGVEP
jgi:hypothetical protein